MRSPNFTLTEPRRTDRQTTGQRTYKGPCAGTSREHTSGGGQGADFWEEPNLADLPCHHATVRKYEHWFRAEWIWLFENLYLICQNNNDQCCHFSLFKARSGLLSSLSAYFFQRHFWFILAYYLACFHTVVFSMKFSQLHGLFPSISPFVFWFCNDI